MSDRTSPKPSEGVPGPGREDRRPTTSRSKSKVAKFSSRSDRFPLLTSLRRSRAHCSRRPGSERRREEPGESDWRSIVVEEEELAQHPRSSFSHARVGNAPDLTATVAVLCTGVHSRARRRTATSKLNKGFMRDEWGWRVIERARVGALLGSRLQHSRRPCPPSYVTRRVACHLGESEWPPLFLSALPHFFALHDALSLYTRLPRMDDYESVLFVSRDVYVYQVCQLSASAPNPARTASGPPLPRVSRSPPNRTPRSRRERVMPATELQSGARCQ